jgi:hypothetical protein
MLQYHQIHAVKAALEMKESLVELNRSWGIASHPALQIRVGINSSVCLVGNVGSEQRMNYTALGDPVNVASRCEGLNKRFGTDIIITYHTYKFVNEIFLCKWLTYVSLKGKSESLHVYEVLCKIEDATDEQKILCSMHLELQAASEEYNVTKAKTICADILSIGENIAVRELYERLETKNSAEAFIFIADEK